MSANNGGPAFPKPGTFMDGMTLRDYFAAKALAAMALKNDGKYSKADHEYGSPKAEANWAATAAYRYADAMLRARDKGETP